MAAVAGPIAAAGISGLFNMAGGKSQASAARYAADLQSKGAEKALAFTKEAAETDWRNWEANRKATYGQWQARERRLGTLGQLVGMGEREIPAYAPSVDPDFTGSAAAPQTRAQYRRMKDLL